MTGSREMFHQEREADMQLSTLQMLALFESTKQERIAFAEDLVERIEQGEIDPLKAHAQVKILEDVVNVLTDKNEKTNKNFAIAKQYNMLIVDAAAKYPKKFEVFNASFETKEVGVKYDYSQCNDPEMAKLLEQQVELDKAVKARQTFLKTIQPKGLEISVGSAEGGDLELVTIYPPSKSSTTSIAVSLK